MHAVITGIANIQASVKAIHLPGGNAPPVSSLLPTTHSHPHDTAAAATPPPFPREPPKGEFPREGGTGDSEASGVKVCGERSMRGVIGRERGGVSWFERLTRGENG